MLFVTLLHLLINLVPFIDRLGHVILGTKHYETYRSTYTKAAKSTIYISYVIIFNLIYFYLTFILFRLNIRFLDLFS